MTKREEVNTEALDQLMRHLIDGCDDDAIARAKAWAALMFEALSATKSTDPVWIALKMASRQIEEELNAFHEHSEKAARLCSHATGHPQDTDGTWPTEPDKAA